MKIILFSLFLFVFNSILSQNCTLDSTLCYSHSAFPAISFGTQQFMESQANTVVYQTPLVADINADCIPEIIMAGNTNYSASPRITSGITVVNSVTGATITSFPTALYSWSVPLSYAIADVDNDGTVEIVIAAANSNSNPVAQRHRLICYDFNGTIQWISNATYGTSTDNQFDGSPSFADFNQDGNPEVYVHNEIFNAQTGQKLVSGGNDGIGQMGILPNIFEICHVSAADLDNNPNDLELAAGFTVYQVNITNTTGIAGNSMTPINILVDGQYRDGLTTFGDINLDNKLDIIVATSGTETTSRLYVYTLDNSNNPQLIAKTAIPRGTTTQYSYFTGPPYVGDIDGNGIPTICLTRNNLLLAYSYNGTLTLQNKWQFNTIDDSGCTGLTSFDFDQDGIQEIVFRDEQNMKIINGNGNVPTILSVSPCSSLTINDMPVVADIDNTGTSKICVTCGTPGSAKLRVYSSNVAQQWAPSRKIWNQFGYSVTNINDDATVPQYQQNNATFQNGQRNNYFIQSSLLDSVGNFIVPACDLFGSINCVTNNLETNTLSIDYTITNTTLSSASFNGNCEISFFNGNPETNGVLLELESINTTILPGNSINGTYTFSNYPNSFVDSMLYMVINSSGANSGITYDSTQFNTLECDYYNNIENYPILFLTASNDTSICGLSTLNLVSSISFISNWNLITGNGSITSNPNSSTFTPNTYGNNVIEHSIISGNCINALDLVNIEFNPTPIFQAMLDTSICSSDSILIGVSNNLNYNYQWGSNIPINDQNNPQVNVSPNSTTEFSITINDPLTNCVSFDTIQIFVNQNPIYTPINDTLICDPESLSFIYGNPSNTYFWDINNTISNSLSIFCDSTIQITSLITSASGCQVRDTFNVIVFESPFNNQNIDICGDDNYYLAVNQYPSNYTFEYSQDGINYTILNDSINITNGSIVYVLTIEQNSMCSTIDTIQITHHPEIPLFAGNDTTICFGSQIELLATSNSFNSTIIWNSNTLNPTILTPNLGVSTYYCTISDEFGCTNTDTIIVTTILNPIAGFIYSPNTIVEANSEITFINTSEYASSYLWDLNGVFSTNTDETYTLSNSSNTQLQFTLFAYNSIGCVDSQLVVIQINIYPILFVPNSFSPDSDEFNNTFMVYFSNPEQISDFRIEIFNRWGELIYESNDYNYGWDGMFKGRLVQDGTYTWRVYYKLENDGFSTEATGHVTVIK